MWPLAVLTVFFIRKCMNVFAGSKRSDRITEVAVKRGFNCMPK